MRAILILTASFVCQAQMFPFPGPGSVTAGTNGFSKVVRLTSNHTLVGATMTQPILLYINNPVFKSVANGGYVQSPTADDVVAFSDPNCITQLPNELVPGTWSATAGTAEAYAKPSLSSTVDVSVYVCVGHPSPPARSTGVFSGFYSVYHFADGTTLSFADASGNGRTGTNVSAFAAAGKIDGGAAFAGAATIHSSMGYLTTFGISAWFATSNGNQASYRTILDRENGAPPRNFFLGLDTAGKAFLTWSVGGNPSACAITGTGVRLDDNAWHHLAGTYDGTTAILYVDGASAGSAACGTPDDPTGVDFFMAESLGGILPLTGSMDEVRTNTTAWVSGQITTDYNSQNSPSTFWTVTVL